MALTLKDIRKRIDSIDTRVLEKELNRLNAIVEKHKENVKKSETLIAEADKTAEVNINLTGEPPWNWFADPRREARMQIKDSLRTISRVNKKINLINEELVERILTGDNGEENV